MTAKLPTNKTALIEMVDRVVGSHALECGIPAVEEWAAGWLSGEDRSEHSAALARQVVFMRGPTPTGTATSHAIGAASRCAAYLNYIEVNSAKAYCAYHAAQMAADYADYLGEKDN